MRATVTLASCSSSGTPRTELAFIRAKYTAKCILERAAFCAEKQDDEDKVTPDVQRYRPLYQTSYLCSPRIKRDCTGS